MYEKIASKLKKGYKALKCTSKSLRKNPLTVASTTRKLDRSSQCAAASSVENGPTESNSQSSCRKEREPKNKETFFAHPRTLSDSEKRWQNIFDNDLFKNWLRVGLALRGTCDAVAPLVDKVLIDFQLELREKYRDVSDMNSRQDIIRDVLRLHRRPISKPEVWKRSDVNKWLEREEGPWEIAKVFLPKGSWGSSALTTARSLDVTGMLNLMTSFKLFENYVSQLEQIRNRTMHNSRLEFSEDEVEFCFDEIQSLLQDGVLKLYLLEYGEFETAVKDIEKIKTMDFNIVTTVKSTFEILEDRLTTENYKDLPSPSAMSSNRELLKCLRRVFGSGEVSFTVETDLIQRKLQQLEELLSGQQDLAVEKLTMLFWKANYLQRQLDRIQRSLASEGSHSPSTLDEELNRTVEKKGKKRKRRGKRRTGRGAVSSQPERSRNGGSKSSLRVNKSRSSMKARRVQSGPGRPCYVPSADVKVSNLRMSNSNNTLLHSVTSIVCQASRHMSSTNRSDGQDEGSVSSRSEGWTKEKGPMDHEDTLQPCDAFTDDCDAPGPSGLPRKRRSSTSLVLFDTIKKSLMVSPTKLRRDEGKGGGIGPADGGKVSSGANATKENSGNVGDGGGSFGEGHFQQILKNLIKQHVSSALPLFEDKKEGEFYFSTVRFQSKYAVMSREPMPTTAEAETNAATEALKRFGLEVTDKNNAKPVLNQFCEAAVGNSPSYFSYASTGKLHLSVVQLHSLFTTFGEGLKGGNIHGPPTGGISSESILLQVKSIDPSRIGKDSMEENCARMALAEANVKEAEFFSPKRAVNELCLRQGGTLPIYETFDFGKGKEIFKRVTTMTSLLREKLPCVDAPADTDFGNSSEWFAVDQDDEIVIVSSTQPSYCRDHSEELAARALLEKMGVVVGKTASEAYRKPYSQVLKENAVHWGYHHPQYHTFEIKPVVDMGTRYFSVVSSRAFHKFTETLSADSDEGMTTVHDARESAARKGLLMLGYPQTFYNSKK